MAITRVQLHHPWNAGRIVSAKPPLKPKHIWVIRTRLQLAGRVRDLAMFNVAIDSKLRGCDLVSLRIGDVMVAGSIRPRSSVLQQKTGRPVPFEVIDATRDALTRWLAVRRSKGTDWLFEPDEERRTHKHTPVQPPRGQQSRACGA